jgi:hypothetical protein
MIPISYVFLLPLSTLFVNIKQSLLIQNNSWPFLVTTLLNFSGRLGYIRNTHCSSASSSKETSTIMIQIKKLAFFHGTPGPFYGVRTSPWSTVSAWRVLGNNGIGKSTTRTPEHQKITVLD